MHASSLAPAVQPAPWVRQPVPRRQQQRVSAAAAPALAEGDDVVGTVVWAGPKGAKVLLPDASVGFMPSREAPYIIRDPNEDWSPPQNRDVSAWAHASGGQRRPRRRCPLASRRRRCRAGSSAAPACIAVWLIHQPVNQIISLSEAAFESGPAPQPPCPTPPPLPPPCSTPPRLSPPMLQAPCLPKGMVRTFKIINIPDQEAAPAPSSSGNGRTQNQTGPLLSARLCDLDVVWQRASQLCEVSVQVRTGERTGSPGSIGNMSSLSCVV
jgi:hypothetical protein